MDARAELDLCTERADCPASLHLRDCLANPGPRRPVAALSGAQGRVYAAVEEIGRDGWPVSVREIMELTGVSSTQPVHRQLVALEELGLLVRSSRRPRSGWRIREGGRS